MIYTGLAGLAVWQALPKHREDPRQRSTGWWTAASLVLNAVWIGTVQLGSVWLSVVVISVLLLVLVKTFGALLADRPRTRVEAVLVDGSIGLYLGWVSIATVANVAAALRSSGLTSGETAGPSRSSASPPASGCSPPCAAAVASPTARGSRGAWAGSPPPAAGPSRTRPRPWP